MVFITHHMLLANTALGTCPCPHHFHFFGLFLALASAFALALAAAFCFAERADSRFTGLLSGADADGFGRTGLQAGLPRQFGLSVDRTHVVHQLGFLIHFALKFETQAPPHAIFQVQIFHSPQGTKIQNHIAYQGLQTRRSKIIMEHLGQNVTRAFW